jgi:hypothetical protein
MSAIDARNFPALAELRKPPIGPNPDFALALVTPKATYDFALQTMQVDDQVTWRRLLSATIDRAAELTRKWMEDNPKVPPNTRVDFAQLLQHAHSGLACFESLTACLLAAAESGREAYSGQFGWIDEIRRLSSITLLSIVVNFFREWQ